ncbi:hypothetical protein VN12_23335 [Pirellula sp. SH-Sr6A]|uniref:hypothetical protein n=1 Tax=Pirellula sp. SH-Sr6A TaxID=1632865 RepID=UPI00078E1EB7|nr:hypothetical protein [Pirellula sp. SH-Sr6A]AMV35079.1 hypothetical protein VN12_23335 [Pirellula sp. SH-Sr6A]
MNAEGIAACSRRLSASDSAGGFPNVYASRRDARWLCNPFGKEEVVVVTGSVAALNPRLQAWILSGSIFKANARSEHSIGVS